GSRSSSELPSAWRVRNSWVLAASSWSDSAAVLDSSALIWVTSLRYCLSNRSLRLPMSFLSKETMRVGGGHRRRPAPWGRAPPGADCYLVERAIPLGNNRV